jgi:6-pyruvoyltetrahydropterin/6-carboxytetrahydropterin synthase
MFIVSKTYAFDAAHHLPHHNGKCVNLHGHTYHVTVEFAAEDFQPYEEGNASSGMVLDFAVIDKITRPIIDVMDHNNLNDRLTNPTAESLAMYFADCILQEMSMCDQYDGVALHAVEVSETPRTKARYEVPR